MIKKFRDIKATDLPLVGWKGFSLGLLTQAGFQVPEWFVLTTKAFDVSKNKREKEALQAFDDLQTQFVAVRSSGTKEDGAEDSFAGQFDTHLFIDRDKLIDHIIQCHESRDSDRMCVYCSSKNINRKEIKVAVVIQKMINSEISWICFTANPVTNNLDECIIEAWFWLWEAVVSGMITPDNYIINKKTNTIVSKYIARQEKMLVIDTTKWWTVEEEIEETIQKNQKLSDTHILQLNNIATHIEQYYKMPMDIERAVENWQIYILQARPITTLQTTINTDTDNWTIRKI